MQGRMNLPVQGGDEAENIFFQETEPITKNGIWFDTSSNGSPELVNFEHEGIEICDNDIMFLGNSKCKYDNSFREGIYSFIDAVNIGDFVYYFGAKSSSTDTANKTYKINILTKERTTLANTPDTFMEIKSVVLDEDIYLACRTGDGLSSSTTSLKLYKYNVLANTYTLMATFGDYVGINVAKRGADIYVSAKSRVATSTGALFKYDTLTNTLSSISMYSAAFSAIASVGDYIYMFTDNSSYDSSNVYRYDPKTNTTVVDGSIPFSIYSRNRILVYGKYIYIFGLHPSRSVYEAYYRAVYKYDTESNSYLYDNASIPDNSISNCFIINGSIYLANETNMYRYYVNTKYFQNKRIYISTDYDSKTIKINEKFHVAIKYVRIFQNGVFSKYKTYVGDGTQWEQLP